MIAGFVALMGSGEMTGTMVETHKKLLARYGPRGRAVFLDTPAGFQLNVDLISQRAKDYFTRHVGHPLEIVSFKSRETVTPEEAEKAYRALGEADFVLMGPGSPTYAVRQWRDTPIISLLSAIVSRGGCLVAASAAALTMGSHTLPVYEIYKVGEPLHWVDGLNLLKPLGLDLIVVPHWNNAEGGNHDTRFCYMGEPRFRILEGMLPEEATVLGVDEHTACIIDFSAQMVTVEGIGAITARRKGRERVFGRGERIPFQFLQEAEGGDVPVATAQFSEAGPRGTKTGEDVFWEKVRRSEASFHRAIDEGDWGGVASSLLELDRLLWEAQQGGENQESISQGREVFRELLIQAGTRVAGSTPATQEGFEKVVREILALREALRGAKKWAEADEIRRCLLRAGVVVEDTPSGPRWRLALHGGGG